MIQCSGIMGIFFFYYFDLASVYDADFRGLSSMITLLRCSNAAWSSQVLPNRMQSLKTVALGQGLHANHFSNSS